MQHKECAHQKAFVQWFRFQYRNHANLLIHIPNGQNVGPIVGKRLKSMGLIAGAPDIFIAIPNSLYHGLFIEMKAEKGRVSKEQKAMHIELKAAGYEVIVAYGALEAIESTKNYLKLDALPTHSKARQSKR